MTTQLGRGTAIDIFNEHIVTFEQIQKELLNVPPFPNVAAVPMKTVFRLQEELQTNPQRVEKTQSLTLNASKPTMGLSGKYGLFGSSEWWDSIAAGKMPLQRLSGVIVRAYVAGQDPDNINTIDIRVTDGSVQAVGIYLYDKADLPLFRVGHAVQLSTP